LILQAKHKAQCILSQGAKLFQDIIG